LYLLLEVQGSSAVPLPVFSGAGAVAVLQVGSGDIVGDRWACFWRKYE
jgi:hypothetical protein